MILLLDTSTPICRLTLVTSDGQRVDNEWQADRQLARGLHAYLRDRLAEHDATLSDVAGIGVMQGPGSFTGLRIGITVMNTLAQSLAVPIVGLSGEDWIERAVERLQAGQNDQIVMPVYGADAHITQPRK